MLNVDCPARLASRLDNRSPENSYTPLPVSFPVIARDSVNVETSTRSALTTSRVSVQSLLIDVTSLPESSRVLAISSSWSWLLLRSILVPEKSILA